MNKHRSIRFVAAAVLAGSALSAAIIPAATAGASAAKVKPAIDATCTGFIGQTTTDQLMYGCSTDNSLSSKVTAQGVQETSGSSATIYWEDKTTTTVTFSYTLITGAAEDCPTLLGVAATAEVSEAVTVTGGTSKLTLGLVPKASLVCAYSAGGDVVENQDTGPSGTGMHI
jgi:hypothetical protein